MGTSSSKFKKKLYIGKVNMITCLASAMSEARVLESRNYANVGNLQGTRCSAKRSAVLAVVIALKGINLRGDWAAFGPK